MDEQNPMDRDVLAILIGLGCGIAVGGCILVLGIAAIFMVGGDGSAPAFTHVMLFVLQAPQKLLGTKSEMALIAGPMFWAVIVALCVTGFLFFKWRDG